MRISEAVSCLRKVSRYHYVHNLSLYPPSDILDSTIDLEKENKKFSVTKPNAHKECGMEKRKVGRPYGFELGRIRALRSA